MLTGEWVNGKRSRWVNEEDLMGVRIASTNVETGLHLEKPEDLTGFPVFDPEVNSSLAKNLTRGVWEQLKTKKDSCGFSFKQAIFSGCQNVDSGVGVIAGSYDSYKTFAALFDPIIAQLHDFSKQDIHKNDMDLKNLSTPQFPEEDAKMIRSAEICISRNLVGFPLGAGVSIAQRLEIEHNALAACSMLKGDLTGTYVSLGVMT